MPNGYVQISHGGHTPVPDGAFNFVKTTNLPEDKL